MLKRPLIVTTVALAASAGLLVAGPLNPPPGPVAPTYRTLGEIEPRTPISPATTPGDADSVCKLTQPGSYYLTGNITAGSGLCAIEVAAADVTIDLSGFTLSGAPGSLDGVSLRGTARRRVCVRNGAIRGFGGGGVSLTVPSPTEALACTVADVRVSDCVSAGINISDGQVRDSQARNCATGIRIAGPFPGLAEGCTATGGSFLGISVGHGTIQRCAAFSVAGPGISIGYGGVVRDCAADDCDTGFSVSNATVTGCTARNCTGGISSNSRSTITGNTVVSAALTAGTTGIWIGFDGNRVEENTIIAQALGVRAPGGNNLVVGNSFRGCTTALNLAAGNRVGVLVTGTSSPAVNGNSGGGLGTSDPHANILY